MAIRVEFFGIARQRAGVGQFELTAERAVMPLGDVLSAIGRQFPRVATDCLLGDRPRPGFVVNLGGQRFVSRPETAVSDGDCVLLLSADAGG